MNTFKLSNEEHRALTMLLRNHLTIAALETLGLQDVCDRLSAVYSVPWECDTSKEKVPGTADYMLLQGRITRD